MCDDDELPNARTGNESVSRSELHARRDDSARAGHVARSHERARRPLAARLRAADTGLQPGPVLPAWIPGPGARGTATARRHFAARDESRAAARADQRKPRPRDGTAIHSLLLRLVGPATADGGPLRPDEWKSAPGRRPDHAAVLCRPQRVVPVGGGSRVAAAVRPVGR